MAKVFLKKKISNRIAEGHPWVFSNEIGDLVGECEPGDIIDVFSSSGSFVGTGFYNPDSQIKVRLLSRRQEAINDDFFLNRIKEAWELRQKIGLIDNCRLVNAEADFLPGLHIDKYNDYFVLQTLSAGIEKWKDTIVKALNSLFKPKGIYERNDVALRSLEGLTQTKGFIGPKFSTQFTIKDNGLPFMVDIENGYQTGFYLDRQSIRKEIAKLASNAEVLDTFCYTGSLGLQAIHAGAKSLVAWDFDQKAIDMAKQNALINNFENRCTFECCNAFDAFKTYQKESKQFDLIIIDPPNMVKQKEGLEKSLAAYKELNLRAMKLLKPGGVLISSISSILINTDNFISLLTEAANDAKKQLRQIGMIHQSGDFPILLNSPSNNNLRFLIAELR